MRWSSRASILVLDVFIRRQLGPWRASTWGQSARPGDAGHTDSPARLSSFVCSCPCSRHHSRSEGRSDYADSCAPSPEQLDREPPRVSWTASTKARQTRASSTEPGAVHRTRAQLGSTRRMEAPITEAHGPIWPVTSAGGHRELPTGGQSVPKRWPARRVALGVSGSLGRAPSSRRLVLPARGSSPAHYGTRFGTHLPSTDR